MDLADVAANAIEVTSNMAYSAVKDKLNTRELTPNNVCYNPLCCSEIENQKLFCDCLCAAEYERFKKLK